MDMFSLYILWSNIQIRILKLWKQEKNTCIYILSAFTFKCCNFSSIKIILYIGQIDY